MNQKKAKKLRKLARAASPNAAWDAPLLVGKTHAAHRNIWLDFKHANQMAEALAEYVVNEPIAGTHHANLRGVFSDLMAQYQAKLMAIYTPEQIDAREHENHEPICVTVRGTIVSVARDPRTQKSIYKRMKSLITGVERNLGKERTKV
jgi:hypothetical protein